MPFVAPTEYTFGHEDGQPTDPIPLLPDDDAIRTPLSASSPNLTHEAEVALPPLPP